MLLHGVKDTEFEIHHGDSLLNDWDILNEMLPGGFKAFDAGFGNAGFLCQGTPREVGSQSLRFGLGGNGCQQRVRYLESNGHYNIPKYH